MGPIDRKSMYPPEIWIGKSDSGCNGSKGKESASKVEAVINHDEDFALLFHSVENSWAIPAVHILHADVGAIHIVFSRRWLSTTSRASHRENSCMCGTPLSARMRGKWSAVPSIAGGV